MHVIQQFIIKLSADFLPRTVSRGDVCRAQNIVAEGGLDGKGKINVNTRKFKLQIHKLQVIWKCFINFTEQLEQLPVIKPCMDALYQNIVWLLMWRLHLRMALLKRVCHPH